VDLLVGKNITPKEEFLSKKKKKTTDETSPKSWRKGGEKYCFSLNGKGGKSSSPRKRKDRQYRSQLGRNATSAVGGEGNERSRISMEKEQHPPHVFHPDKGSLRRRVRWRRHQLSVQEGILTHYLHEGRKKEADASAVPVNEFTGREKKEKSAAICVSKKKRSSFNAVKHKKGSLTPLSWEGRCHLLFAREKGAAP